MTEDQVPQLHIHEPGEVAQLVPHLIGFQPDESLVIVVLQRGRIEVTARADIADVQQPGRAEELLDRIWNRYPDADAYLMAYTHDQVAGWDLLQRCEDHLPPFADRQTMLVGAETWHTGDGRSGVVDRLGRVAAEAAFHGLSVLERRSDLHAQFTSAENTAELRAVADQALAALPEPLDHAAVVETVRALIERNLTDPSQPSPAGAGMSQLDAMQLSALVATTPGRQVALLSMTRTNAEQHLQLWRTVINQTAAEVSQTPLHLAGMAAWITGDGATADIALERAEAVPRPGTRPFVLLDALIDHVVPPYKWTELREDILSQTDPAIRQAVGERSFPVDSPWETVQPPTSRPSPYQGKPLNPPAPGIAI